MTIGKSTLSPFAKAVLNISKDHLNLPETPDVNHLNPYGEHADHLGAEGIVVFDKGDE